MYLYNTYYVTKKTWLIEKPLTKCLSWHCLFNVNTAYGTNMNKSHVLEIVDFPFKQTVAFLYPENMGFSFLEYRDFPTLKSQEGTTNTFFRYIHCNSHKWQGQERKMWSIETGTTLCTKLFFYFIFAKSKT